MRRAANVIALVAIVAVLAAGYVHEALHTAVQSFDEPLWFMRSQVTPGDLSTPAHRYWAIDIPGVNRWVYYAVLKAAGLDKVPPGEKPCWSLQDGYFSFQKYKTDVKWRPGRGMTLEAFQEEHGMYAPKLGIMAMRMVDIATFVACLVLMWWTAWMVLRSVWLAALAVAPLVISPVFAADISYIVGSADCFLAALLAATLAAWTYCHLKGTGTSMTAIAVVSALAGAATGAKHPGVLAVVAFAVYLAWQSRGWDRVIKPAVACAVAFGVFAVINPAVFLFPGERPWNVLALMVERRHVMIVQHIGRTPFSATESLKFFWFPLAPLACYSLWVARKQRWFPAVGLWALFLVVGTVAGMTGIRVATERYLAPLEMGVFFPISLVMLSVGQRLAAARAESA